MILMIMINDDIVITQASMQLSCYSIRMVTTFETNKKIESVQMEMIMESRKWDDNNHNHNDDDNHNNNCYS